MPKEKPHSVRLKSEQPAKKQKFAPLSNRLFPELPSEITSIITGYLPYSKHVMARVSKTWQHNVPNYIKTSKKEEVIASCRSSLDAIAILNDEKYLDEFSANDLLSLAAWVPEIVSDQALHTLLTREKRAILVRKTPSDVIALLKSNVKLSDAESNFLFTNNPELAQAILNDKTICYTLPQKILDIIRRTSLENALKVFNDEGLRKIVADKIYYVGGQYPELAKLMLQNLDMRQSLDSSNLVDFANTDESVAQIILDDKVLCDSLPYERWIAIASKYKNIALKILALGEITCSYKIMGLAKDKDTVDAVLKYLNDKKIPYGLSDACSIAQYSESAAKALFNRYSKFLPAFNLYFIARSSEQLALEILRDEKLRAQVMQNNGVLPWIKIPYPAVSAELAKHVNLEEAIYFASLPSFTGAVFFDEACKRYDLTRDHLCRFGAKNEQIALKILTNAKFVKKLHKPKLAGMIRAFPRAIHLVLSTPELKRKLPKTSKNIFKAILVSHNSPWGRPYEDNLLMSKNANIILSDPALREIFAHQIPKLEREQLITTRIHELAKGVRAKYLPGNECPTFREFPTLRR